MASEIGTLLMSVLGLGLMIGLCGGPFWLYRHYRRKSSPEAFATRWTEDDDRLGYRDAEREMKGRLELGSRVEVSTKIGFFLGLLGFGWTPFVLLGLADKMMPMAVIGLPGLAVAWSIFFSSRAVLMKGSAAVSWLRATAIGEALLNVWVLAVVVLSTIAKDRDTTTAMRDSIASFLGAGGSSLETYTIPYALQCGGIVAVGYALLSFAHAWVTLAACKPLAAARQQVAAAE